MPENAGAINVKFTADVSGLEQGTEKAKASVKSATREIKNDASIISETFKAVAGAAVVSFAQKCITEFAAVERSIKTLGTSVRMNGEDWASLEEATTAYLDSAERATRFNDTDVANSLTNLNTLSRNLSVSLGLNELAMNLAVARNMSLAQASDIVGQAFVGNQRGVVALAKELGITGKNAEKSQYLFEQLTKRFDKMAEAEEGAARNMEKLHVSIGNIMEDIGEGLSGTLKNTSSAIDQWWWNAKLSAIAFMATVGDVISYVKQGVDTAIALGKAMFNIFEAPIKRKAKFHEELLAIDKKYSAEREEMDKAWQEQFEKTLNGTTESVKKANGRKLALLAQNNQDRIKGDEDTNKALLAENQRYQDALKQEAKDRNDYEYWIMTDVKGEEIQALVRQQQMSKETYQKMRADAEAYATAVSTYTKEAVAIMIEEYNKGTLSVGRAFEIMGKQIAKALIKAVGDALMQMAAKDFVLAMAAMARKEYSAAAEFAIAGGIESAGAGAIYAVADSIKLAKGGIVQPNDGSQKFEIGEAGRPELVMPLDTAAERGLLGGGGQAKISMTINGVTDAASFESNYSSIERRLMATWENMNRRRGLRTA